MQKYRSCVKGERGNDMREGGGILCPEVKVDILAVGA
jgi:hypothetical protein